MFFIFLGNSRLSAALSIGGSLLFLLNGNYGLELPRALQQTMHAAHSTFARMWPVIETASFALLVVTVLLLSGDWWVGEALGLVERGEVVLVQAVHAGRRAPAQPVLGGQQHLRRPILGNIAKRQKRILIRLMEALVLPWIGKELF